MLCIKKDHPGQQLLLENVGKSSLSLQERLGCFAAIVLILIVAGVLGYVVFDAPVSTVSRVLFALSMLSLIVIRKVVFPQKHILTLHADGDTRQLEMALGFPGYPPSRNRIVAFTEIEMVRFVVPHGMKRGSSHDIPFELWVYSSKKKFKEKVQISGINTDLELLDVLLRLANIILLPYYRIVVNDPQNFEACITRVAEQDSQAVPKILETADYKKGTVTASVTAPSPQVATGSQGEHSLPPTLNAPVWDTEQKVEIVKNWELMDYLRLGGAFLAIIGGALMWIRPDLIAALLDLGKEQAVILKTLRIPVLFGGIGYAGWMLLMLRYYCQLDFTTGQAKIRMRGGWKSFNFADVQELVLIQKIHAGSSSKQGSRKTSYTHQLEARLHNGDSYQLMFERSASSLHQCKRHYNELWPFTATLAELLNVPARYTEKE